MELSITACHGPQPGIRLAIVGAVQGVAASRVRSVLAHLITVTRPELLRSTWRVCRGWTRRA
jgi:hypothetical protein